jgi:hypothetical protein
MGKRQHALRLLRNVQNPHAAEVVDIKRVEQGIIEVDAGRVVDDHLNFGNQDFFMLRREAKTTQSQVASYREDFLGPHQLHGGILFEIWIEDFRLKNLL